MVAVRKTRVLIPLAVKLYSVQFSHPGPLRLLPDRWVTRLVCRVVGRLPAGLWEAALRLSQPSREGIPW